MNRIPNFSPDRPVTLLPDPSAPCAICHSQTAGKWVQLEGYSDVHYACLYARRNLEVPSAVVVETLYQCAVCNKTHTQHDAESWEHWISRKFYITPATQQRSTEILECFFTAFVAHEVVRKLIRKG